MVTLHKKIYDHLENGPLTSEELIERMPDEKRVSIRAIITLHPELFIRITKGIVGRRNRDEHLAKFYEQAKTKIPTIVELIKCFLATGPKALQEIYGEFPDIKEQSIVDKLTQDDEILCLDEGKYALKT
jgi:hypothetical protein